MSILLSMPQHQITEDVAALRQVMRLRGFSLMTNVLEDHGGDIEIIIAVCIDSLSFVTSLILTDSGFGVYVDVAAITEKQGGRL